MKLSAPVRKLILGLLMVTIALTIVAASWLLWPVYQEHAAVQQLEEAAAARNAAAFDEALARLERLRHGEAAVAALSDMTRSADSEVTAPKRVGSWVVLD